MLASQETLAQQTSLERVEVTGSSIRRVDAETALPVQIITRQDIEKTGVTTVEQLLQQVSAATSSGALMASSASGATTGGLSGISLRGLTSIRTLVLINGRRIAPYGAGFVGDSVSVDVNSIPLEAVDRVEILKDGASAIYGSDAIAGVVNFILRKDYKGLELKATYGDTSQGGADFKKIGATWGAGDLTADKYNILVTGSYQKEGALFGAQRKFAASGIHIAPDSVNDTTSGNTFPGNIFISNPVAESGKTRNPLAPACPGPYATLDPNFPSTRCRFDPSPLVALIPATDRASFYASGRLQLNNNWEAFAELSYNKNKQHTVIQPVPLSDQFSLPDTHPLFNVYPYTIPASDPVWGWAGIVGKNTFLLQPSSPYYPAAYVSSQGGNPTYPILVRYRSVGTGNRDLTDISEAPRFTTGLRGTLFGWDTDGAFLWTESKVREQVNGGYPALSKILPLLNSGTVNPFGPNTPAVQAELDATGFTGDAFRIKSSIMSLAGKASRDLMALPGGPLAVAVGAEARKEKYLFDPSPTIMTGDISGYGGNFLLTDKSRNVDALFAEINAPIFKVLEADAAVRYDHYQGVGNSTTPKFSLRFQPIREVLMRGSIGKGFRAPSLQDLYLPNTTGVTVPGLSDPLRCPTTGSSNDCQTQFPVTFGGNPHLKPEKSTNLTLGLVLQPSNNVSLALDYFKIKVTDTIVNGVDAAQILSDPVKYAALIARGPAAGGLPGPITNVDQTNLNLGTIKVAGVDIDGKVTIPTSNGRWTVSLNGTYFSKYDVQNPDGTFSGGIDQVNSATGGVVPRWKHHLSVDWSRGPWAVTVAQNFQKHYHDLPGSFDDPSFSPRDVGSYETYDAQVSYSGLMKDLKLTLGVKNLFNRAPPYTNAGGQTSFQAGYDIQYGDPRGRFLYLTAGYKFF